MEEAIGRLCNSGLPIFVVLDGARVSGIDKLLAANELEAHPIFYGNDSAVILSGPWLVPVDQVTLHHVVRIAQRCASGVCWAVKGGKDVIIRHLRALNVARLPDERMVYFRHYDPDVLAFLIPLFDAEQAAKIFGPAQMIGFVTGRSAGATVENPGVLPQAKGGPLTFTNAQMDQLFERQLVLARQRTALSLKEAFPERYVGLTESRVMIDVEEHEASAIAHGFSSEWAFFQWAYLRILTKNKVDRNVPLVTYIRRNGPSELNNTLDRDMSRIMYDFFFARNLHSAGVSYQLRKL